MTLQLSVFTSFTKVLERVTYAQVSLVIILYFSRYRICFALRNYNFMTSVFVIAVKLKIET